MQYELTVEIVIAILLVTYVLAQFLINLLGFRKITNKDSKNDEKIIN